MSLHHPVRTTECSGVDGIQFAPSYQQLLRWAYLMPRPTRLGVVAPPLGEHPTEMDSYFNATLNSF
jgi:hypothetical protein